MTKTTNMISASNKTAAGNSTAKNIKMTSRRIPYNDSFQTNDNVFVNFGKSSHPAKFIEYIRNNDNDCMLAKVRYNTSSTVEEVEIHRLELMDKRTRLRSPKKADNSQQNTQPLTTPVCKPHQPTASSQKAPVAASSLKKADNIQQTTLPLTTPVAKPHQPTASSQKVPVAASSSQPQKLPPHTNSFKNYNNGLYRICNPGKHFTSWICDKYQIQCKGKEPSELDFNFEVNDVQNIRR